jgi:hypothetical protein
VAGWIDWSVAGERLAEIWMPVGVPGFSGEAKQRRAELLDERFGADGWRWGYVVRGQVVGFDAAIAEYEQGYRVYLTEHPEIVEWLVAEAGNVYDERVENVFDDGYLQPSPVPNHYQDISVRRVVAELTGTVGAGSGELEEMVDLSTGETHVVPRAPGFRGPHLVQLRDADSPAYFLNPALVPIHDPALITTLPGRSEWYHSEGCAHLSIEAYWQQCKVIEVRYDRFVALGELRHDPLAGI